MKCTFPLLILLLTTMFFGSLSFAIVASITFAFLLYTGRDRRLVVFALLIPVAFLNPVLAILPILSLLIMEEDNFNRAFYFLGALFLVFVMFPILNLLLYASPSALQDSALMNAILVSVVGATIATTIALIFALPLGYVLARRDFPGKGFVESIIDLPIVVPHTVAGIILLLVFGSTGIWGAPLEEIGIKFYYAMPGIVVAMLFVSAPFLINQVREGVAKVDERYEYTAMSLGAGKFRAFWDVVLPQIRGNILSGAVNTWARAVSEFGAVMMIAFYPMIAPTYIYFLYANYGLKAALPATSLLLLLTLAIFIAMRYLSRRFSND